MANNVEKRYVQSNLEVRTEEGKPTVIEGYAAVFGDETVIGGAFAERVARSAFDGANMGNTVALFNHDVNQPLARVGYGLELEVDERGLKYRFELGNQSYAKDLAENIRMGNVGTSSFGFTVKDDSWERRDDGMNLRTIEAVDLLFDVSPTTQGAYPTTEVGLRSMEAAFANEAVAELEEEVIRSEEEVEDKEDCGCGDKAIEPVQRTEKMEEEEEEEEMEEKKEDRRPGVDSDYDGVKDEDEEEEEKKMEEDEEEEEEDEQEERVDQLVDNSILPHPYALDENPEPEARSNNNNSNNMENKEKNAPAYIQGLGDVAEKLQKRYDFGKAIREAAQGRLTGLEAEMNQEARSEFTSSKVNVSGGINVPSFLTSGESRAALGTVDSGSGNNESDAFGGQIGKVDSGLVGAFAAGDLATKMGVRNITSATGDVVFQVQTTTPTVGTPAEATAQGINNPAFAARTLAPKRYSAHVQVTEQLLAQSSQDMGAFVAQEIRKAIDAKFSADVAAKLHGAADSHNVAAVGTGMEEYSNTSYNSLHLEEFLLGNDVDLSNVRVAASALAYRQERQNSLDAGSGLLFASSPADRKQILGYDAVVSSQIDAGELFMADVTQLVQCTWGGVNLIIDPYTDADHGVVRIIANMYKDFSGLNYNGIIGYDAA
jgi:hypothetical protein